MCIAILNRAEGKPLTRKRMVECWKGNPDGAGLLYSTGKKLEVFKELHNFKLFWKEYMRVRKEYPESNIAIHFRIATSGKVNLDNCHPFLITKEIGLIHNGILNCKSTKQYSDTWHFTKMLREKVRGKFWKDGEYIEKLSEITKPSKMILLNKDNEAFILNESLGIEETDGNWYSNYSYDDCWDYYYGYDSRKTYPTNDYPSSYGIKSTFDYDCGDSCHSPYDQSPLYKGSHSYRSPGGKTFANSVYRWCDECNDIMETYEGYCIWCGNDIIFEREVGL